MSEWTDKLLDRLTQLEKTVSVLEEKVRLSERSRITEDQRARSAHGSRDIFATPSHLFEYAIGGAYPGPYPRLLRLLRGSALLMKVQLVVDAAISLSTTDYWTVTVYRRRASTATTAAQATGEILGTYATDTRNLVAGTAVTIYESTQGLPMTEGESLVATYDPTGSPTVLTDAVLLHEWQRKVG